VKTQVTTVLTFLLLCASIGKAQFFKGYGIKVAYTSASQTLDYPAPPWGWWNGTTTSARSGFNVGVFAEWLNVPFISVVSQVEYAQRGANAKYAGPGGWWTTDGLLQYLSVPIMARVTIPTGPVSPYLLAGPRADFLLSYRELGIKPWGNATSLSFYSNFKRANLGASLGVGVETSSILPARLLAELRYNVDIFDSYNDGNLKSRNNAFDVWLGVAL
jgi:hypothetical protein